MILSSPERCSKDSEAKSFLQSSPKLKSDWLQVESRSEAANSRLLPELSASCQPWVLGDGATPEMVHPSAVVSQAWRPIRSEVQAGWSETQGHLQLHGGVVPATGASVWWLLGRGQHVWPYPVEIKGLCKYRTQQWLCPVRIRCNTRDAGWI